MSIMISGFSDEISSDLAEQIRVVKKLGMHYISLRGINGKNIADFSVDEFSSTILPLLNKEGIKVSSIGSPIGKISVNDEEAFQSQLTILDTLCQIAVLLKTKYIRIFSFFIDKEDDYDSYEEVVVNKLAHFINIAEKYDIILLHENEKDIFGDIGRRCVTLFNRLPSPYFKAIFDFANFVQCGDNTLDVYSLLEKHIVYFHIKDAVYTDNHNVLCGTGNGYIKALLSTAIYGGYSGFLTLEPHLADFGSFKSLELDNSKKVINTDTKITGAQGYEMQYNALMDIIKDIK